MAFGCVFASFLIKKLGVKDTIILGSLLQTIYILSSAVPLIKHNNPRSQSFLLKDSSVVIIVFITSILSGLGDAMLWVALGKYLTQCSNRKTKGFYFSYFWGFFIAS